MQLTCFAMESFVSRKTSTNSFLAFTVAAAIQFLALVFPQLTFFSFPARTAYAFPANIFASIATEYWTYSWRGRKENGIFNLPTLMYLIRMQITVLGENFFKNEILTVGTRLSGKIGTTDTISHHASSMTMAVIWTSETGFVCNIS